MTGNEPYDFREKYVQTNAITRWLLASFFRSVGSLLKGLDISSAAEIGCGEGFSTQKLRAMLPMAAAFDASDVEDRLVRAASAANPGVVVSQESIYSLNRPDSSLDLVLALEVLEHLDDPQRAMRELCRVSRRWLILSVPREPLWRALNMVRGKYWTDRGNTPGHIQHWSTCQFRQFVGQFAAVRQVRTPLPWTIVLAEKKPS